MEIPLKFVLLRTGEYRRIRLAAPTMAAVQATVRHWVSGAFALRYTDDEGDVVTMEGEDEWTECLALWTQAQPAGERPAPLLLRVEPQRAAGRSGGAGAGAGALLRRARREAATGRPGTAAACVAAAAVAATLDAQQRREEDSARSSQQQQQQQQQQADVSSPDVAAPACEWAAAASWEAGPPPAAEPLGNPWAAEAAVEADDSAGDAEAVAAEAAAEAAEAEEAAVVPEAEEEAASAAVVEATLAWPAEEEARPEVEADCVVPVEAAAEPVEPAAAPAAAEEEQSVCPNCDYAVTGVHPTNCCFLCSVRPGAHGRRCLRQQVGGGDRVAERVVTEPVVVEEYASQHAALRSMGFCDREQCERVLKATRGDTQMAVDLLFAQ